ncbi:hypothetical protein AAZX31_02G244700 [Glycine max]|uniref:Uncharacterized protein n=2 Tax=Glycine subgen. Soja TaxID=1462606 RepID=I1JIC7_SOYBN|nr:uncharacterized protein LOC100782905 [Glycine max]XP_028217516.1 uncharacterized protein LOC114399514 [Glycine soja]KAG5053091.1 hypothetical protein JHK87_005289 [Glycine soja]KAG5081385.1 hypothetical protein JHK86_005450 [Glycine max]KAH1062141.1 hypothetical protein GYH30_005251 [Glycine max]KAH1263370.1 hypothetical protein GmHk_02G005783 [Glycine max]KRH73237.1 hypothetical protein GLYMA_02G261000v4 [Glycine max]|eukprot:XP_003518418.1 uncharacterized protein LOC100782905 [Glycine max]
MAYYRFLDVFSWIQNLPPIPEWKTSSMSLSICSTNSSQPSLNLTIAKNHHQSSRISLAIVADFNIPISLWTSKPFKPSTKTMRLTDDETLSNLLVNFIEEILHYGTNKHSIPYIKFPKLDSVSNFQDIFNLAFLTLLFLVCIYEAPSDLRSGCLNTLKEQLAGCQSRQASKFLMKLLGSNLEEQWMRSVNLAITNWIVEIQQAHHTDHTTIRTPSPLFSYAFSTFGLWKVQLYCPVINMDVVNANNHPADERLEFSLKYQQLEGVLQFNYKVIIRERWVEIVVNIDNIRCDVLKLVNDILMRERGAGAAEKHFPSRISLQLTPTLQHQVLTVSVGKSSENPRIEFGVEKGIEASFEPPNPYIGLSVSAGESTTVSLKPWKFEQSVHGYSANLNWFLHDSTDGKEVFSTKPSKVALFNPKSWFKDRYSSAYRPFTRQGGVIFARDEYGESVCWKVDKGAVGKTMEWEIRGWIWLTYWPNKHKTFYHETRRLEFRETVYLKIA